MTHNAVMPGAISASFAHMMSMNPPTVLDATPFMSHDTMTAILQPVKPVQTGMFAVPALVDRVEPRGSTCDTICISLADILSLPEAPTDRRLPREVSHSIHRVEGLEFIKDDEISRVILHPDEFHHETGRVRFGWTRYGRAMVQQVGYRGCGAACVAMLQLDHGVAPDWNWVARNNLSTREHRANVLDDSGLLPGVADVSASDPIQVGENLEHLLRHYYSGILGLGGELGGHVVVLDYFSMKDNLAIIREPFHGWSIATLASAVLNRYPDEFTGVIPHGEAQ